MNMAAKAFGAYLEKRDIKYTIRGDDEDMVLVRYAGDNMSDIPVWFNFSTNTHDVAVRVVSIAKIPENKIANACFACSKLNSKYRWVKFYLDFDNEVTAELDAIITPSTVGEVCYELLRRIKNIVDETYLIFMQTIWS